MSWSEIKRVGERKREKTIGMEQREQLTRGGGLGSSTIFKNLMSPTPRRKWYLTTGRRAYLRNEKKNCQKEMHFMFQIGPKLQLYILIYIYTNETYIYSRLLRIGCIQVDILKSQRYTY